MATDAANIVSRRCLCHLHYRRRRWIYRRKRRINDVSADKKINGYRNAHALKDVRTRGGAGVSVRK